MRARVKSSGTDSTLVCLHTQTSASKASDGKGCPGKRTGLEHTWCCFPDPRSCTFLHLGSYISYWDDTCTTSAALTKGLPHSQETPPSDWCPPPPEPFMAPHDQRCQHRMGTLMSVEGSLRNCARTTWTHWSVYTGPFLTPSMQDQSAKEAQGLPAPLFSTSLISYWLLLFISQWKSLSS